jgi:hypothetical protein
MSPIDLTTVDYSNVDAVKNAAMSVAGLNAKKTTDYLTGLFFRFGKAAADKQATVVPDHAPVFAAFRAANYNDATGNKLADKSAPVYMSGAGAYTMAGFFKAYDAQPVAAFVDGLGGSNNLGARGTIVRAILAAHPDKCPTAADMAAFAPVKKKATARGDAEDMAEDFDKKFGKDGTHAATIDTPEKRLAVIDVQMILNRFVKIHPIDPVEAVNLKTEADKLRAEIKAAKEGK